MVAGVAQSRSFTTFGGVALPPCATQLNFCWCSTVGSAADS